MVKILAICDSDIIYATRLMEYVKKRKEFDFEISVFSKMDSLKEFLKTHCIEIMLMDPFFMKEELPTENIRYIYELSDSPGKEEEDGYPCIFKYHAANSIMTELFHDYQKRENAIRQADRSGEMKLVTIVSVIPEITKSAFAWSFSILLSNRKKVLFIPLEFFSIPFLSIEDNTNQSLSEFIYHLKEYPPDLIIKMRNLLNYQGNLSFLTGLSHGFDLLSLNREDITKWTQLIRENTDYQTVIFYVTCYTEAMAELVKQSDSVFMLLKDKLYENNTAKEWERQMEMVGCSMEQNRFQHIYIEEEESLCIREMSLQELQDSNMWAAAMKFADSYEIQEEE